MIGELVAPVLVIVFGWLVRQVFKWLNVEIDDGTFNAIVASLVTFMLALLGVEAGVRAGLF